MYLIRLFQNTILFNHYSEYHKTVCILSNWLKIYLNVLIMTDISYLILFLLYIAWNFIVECYIKLCIFIENSNTFYLLF